MPNCFSILSLLLCMVSKNVLISFFFFTHSCPVFPASSTEDCLSSIVQSCLLCHRLIDQRCLVLFLGFLSCSIDLYFFVCARACVCVCEYYFDKCSFVVQSEVKESDSSSSIFLSQDCFLAIWGLLCFHRSCKNFCSNFEKNAIDNLIEIALTLQTALDSAVILTIESSNSRTWYIFPSNLYYLFLSSASYNIQSTSLLYPQVGLFLGILFFLMLW